MNKSALILIDFINEIIDEKGKLAGKGYAVFVKEHDIIKNLNFAIEKARERNIPIIFVCVGFSKDYKELPESSPLFGTAKKFGALQLNTWATEIHKDINKNENDIILTKHRISAFYSTSLNLILKNLKVDTLLIGGVATDLAVQTTVREAHDRDYKVIILEDLCGAANQKDHNNTIKLLEKISIVSKSDKIAELIHNDS